MVVHDAPNRTSVILCVFGNTLDFPIRYLNVDKYIHPLNYNESYTMDAFVFLYKV